MPRSPSLRDELTTRYRLVRYLIALVVGTAITMLLVAFTWRYLVDQRISDFETQARFGRDLVNHRLISTDEFLGSIASYIDVLGTPDAALFRGFLDEALKRHSFIKAAYYLPMVPHGYRQKFEQEMNASGYIAFRIKVNSYTGMITAPEKERYFPVLLLEPFSPISARMVGFDISSGLSVETAIEKAATSAEVVQANIDSSTPKQESLWLLKAIYSGRDIPTDEARRKAYINGVAALEISKTKLLASERLKEIQLLPKMTVKPLDSDIPLVEFLTTNQHSLSAPYHIQRPGYDIYLTATRNLKWSDLSLTPLLFALFLGFIVTLLILLLTAGSLRRRESLAALKESERRLALLMSNLPGMAYRRLNDKNWSITFASEGAMALTGYSAKQLITGELTGFSDLIAKEDVECVEKVITESLLSNQPFNVSYQLVTSDNRKLWVLEYGKGVINTEPAIIEGIVMDISERKQAEDEVQKLNETLETRVIERTHELQVANQDLSQTLNKLRSAQSQLIESEKMAALGSIVAGVAHEINTPIGIGVTAASTLFENCKELAEDIRSEKLTRNKLEAFQTIAQSSSDIIVKNLQKAGNLIQSFKEVAVDQSCEHLRLFNVKEYIKEILLTATPRLKKARHNVYLDCPDSLVAFTYPSALYQILTNLIMNSIKHGFKGIEEGKINILVKLDDDNASHIEMSYSDNGHGMTDETIEKIFQPFFTTARNEGGSGLGMHVAYNLVTQKLKGEIVCQTSQNKGASFFIKIPKNL